MSRPRCGLDHQSLTSRGDGLEVSADHIDVVVLTAAVGPGQCPLLDTFLQLLPRLLTSEPGHVPDPHAPRPPQSPSLGLHLLEPLCTKLIKPFQEALQDGELTVQTLGGVCCWDTRLGQGPGGLSSVILQAGCLVLELVQVCGCPGVALIQVVHAFSGKSSGLFKDRGVLLRPL